MGSGESTFEEEEEEVDARAFLARATLFERLCDFYDEFNPEMFEAWGAYCSPRRFAGVHSCRLTLACSRFMPRPSALPLAPLYC
jgi:hypothetical protein